MQNCAVKTTGSQGKMRSKHNTQKPSDLLLKTNLMKMVTQFYICEMAKEYINTIIMWHFTLRKTWFACGNGHGKVCCL